MMCCELRWARKMAIDALELDEAGDDNQAASAAVDEILKQPERLLDLELEFFAEELERQVTSHFSR